MKKTDTTNLKPPAKAGWSKIINPKDVAGSNRLDLSLISPVAMMEESLAMMEGLIKYGRANFVGSKIECMLYIGACFRHLFKFICGEDRDPKTGVHHLASARACLGIILECQARGKLFDNRPPRMRGFSKLLDSFEAKVKHLRSIYPGFNPKHWTIADNVEDPPMVIPD